MPDAAPAQAPAAPTTTTSAAPTAATPPAAPQGATVTLIKAHHSAQQPRADDGKFSTPPPAPQVVKVDGRDVPLDELLVDYKGRVVDHGAYEEARKELARLKSEMERFKDPHAALTPEQRQEIARRELAAFLEQQEEAKLPPEERHRRAEVRAALAERDRLKGELQKREQSEQEAQQEADRQHAVLMVRESLKALGEEERPGVAMREVAAELRAAAMQGKQYPPEVIAHRVRQRLDGESLRRVASMPVARVLANQEIVKALNAIEDPQVLQALAPLIERGRLLNLQRLGAVPAGGPQPVAAPTPLQPGQQPKTDAEWAAHFNAGNRPQNPAEFNRYLALRDRGAVR